MCMFQCKHLWAFDDIEVHVNYEVSEDMDISEVVPISAETHYSDILAGQEMRRHVKRLYNSHLLEFSGMSSSYYAGWEF